jgi:hypothetical protein
LASTALLLFGVTGAVSRWRAGVLADRMGSRLLFPAWLGAAASGLLAIAAGLLSGTTVPEVAPVLVGAALFGAGYRAVLNLSLLAAFAALAGTAPRPPARCGTPPSISGWGRAL